jgi:hypothetical protein
MPGQDDYRRKAETCVAQADTIRDPQERAALLTIAQLYMKLAARIRSRCERATAHNGRRIEYDC